VVSAQIGRTNAWDRGVTRTSLDLLDHHQLAAIAAAGVEIGCHSRSHANLPTLDATALAEEIEGSVSELREAGFDVRLLAYPYGEHDARVRAAAAAAGLDAAFTVTPGCVAAGDDPFQLQRIEIRPSDTGQRFLRKVRTARENGAPPADRLRTAMRRSLHLARPAAPLL
jgi:peptidoglycan/xylan/chitin deacetylase (PgdA/CDA1 family)